MEFSKEALEVVVEHLKNHNFRNIAEDLAECHEKIVVANSDPNSLSSHKSDAKVEATRKVKTEEVSWTKVFWHYYPTIRDCALMVMITLIFLKVVL